jgi:hypothetical protein
MPLCITGSSSRLKTLERRAKPAKHCWTIWRTAKWIIRSPCTPAMPTRTANSMGTHTIPKPLATTTPITTEQLGRF